jgi:hypothetical protein
LACIIRIKGIRIDAGKAIARIGAVMALIDACDAKTIVSEKSIWASKNAIRA